MKIDDLVQLLDNRLREFKLSRDYAKMNGDLERMNIADKEIISLEDTLFKLNLLVDTSKSDSVKEKATLAEALTDGSVSVLSEYDITSYATDPKHEEKIMNILSKMGVMDTEEKIDDYIKGKYRSSPVTGEMVMSAAEAYTVDARLMMAIMEQDSSFGTAGKAVRTLNPGNVGNDDGGNLRFYDSWQEGVTAVAEWLSRHRGSTITSEIPEEIVLEPTTTSTTTPETVTAEEEDTTSTTTPETVTAEEEDTTSTTTPETVTTEEEDTTSTTTPETVTTEEEDTTSTTTPETVTTEEGDTTSTTTPSTSTTTEETDTTSTTTPSTST